MRVHLRDLLRASAQHAAAYVELFEQVMVEWRDAGARRIAYAVLGLLFAIVALGTLSAALVLMFPDPSPHAPAAAGIAALWLVLSGLFLYGAARRRERGPAQQRLDEELARDRELLRKWRERNDRTPTPRPRAGMRDGGEELPAARSLSSPVD